MPRPSFEALEQRQREFDLAPDKAAIDALTLRWLQEDLGPTFKPEPEQDPEHDPLFSKEQCDLIGWGIGKMAAKLRKEFIDELNIVRERLAMPIYKQVVRVKSGRGRSW